MLGEWAYGEGEVSVKLLIGRWTHMLEDEAVLQNHGQMKDAPNWRKALAVDHQLLRLLSDGYVQLGYLHGHALALQHLNGLHLLACPQAPAQQVNICSAFSLQRHIHSMALNAASVQASWLSSDKVDHVMWHQESDGAVHGMDNGGLRGVHSRKDHSPLGGQDELGGAAAGKPDCEREAEAAYSSGDDVHAVPARCEGLADRHLWYRLCADLLLCTTQLI